MTHEDYKEALAANALTALDAVDVRALESHLAECADCRLEMSAWEETAALLALDAKPVEPSAQVRDRILAGIRAEVGEQNPQTDYSDRRADGPTQAQAGQRDSTVLPFERPQRDVWASLRSFGAIAATIVFGALIIALVVLWQQNSASRREIARLDLERRQTREQLDHERAIVELMTSPDAHMAKLAGTNMAPGAHAMLAYNKNGHAMLMAKGLPAAPQGMAYQLWYIKDNKKMPGKVFTLDAAGNGILEDDIPSGARDSAVFAITLEPETGVQVPTGSIYLLSAS